MSIIPFNQFLEKYPFFQRIGTGVYGKVYSTIENKIVKAQKIGAPLIKELAVLTKYRHPGLYQIEAVAFHRTSGYFVTKKGIPLQEAFRKKLITIEEIVSDLIETVSFLHKNGIVHCDIKKANLIYDPDEKRLKIIDFGISRFGEYHPSYKFHFKGVAYSPQYRDPEFREYTNNQFITEMYSIAAVVYFLYHLHGEKYYFDFSFLKEKEENFSNPENIDGIIDILERCQSFLENREEIASLLLHPTLIKERVNLENSVVEEEKIDFSLEEDTDDYIFSSLTELYEYSSRDYLSKNTVSNVLYLFFKCLKKGIRQHSMLMKVCYYISISLKNMDVAIPYNELLDYYSLFQEVCTFGGLSFFKRCSSYSLNSIISKIFSFEEDENFYLDGFNDSIYNFPRNYTSDGVITIMKNLAFSSSNLGENISKIVIFRKFLRELEVSTSTKILKGLLSSYNYELLKRLLNFDTTIYNYHHFLSDAQYNIFSFRSEEELIVHLS